MLNNSHTVKAKRSAKLVPKFVRNLRQGKQSLLEEFRRTRDPALKPQINQISRRIAQELREWEEDKHLEILTSLNDPETRWGAFQKTFKRRSKLTTLIGPDNTAAYRDADKADLIAQHLAEKFTELYPESVRPEVQAFTPPGVQVGNTPRISVTDVRMAVLASKLGSSPGHDGLPYRVFKLLPEGGYRFLSSFFTAILGCQWYPTDWKHAVLIPIPKEGKDPHAPGSYRPISLTTCISKIFEKCLLPHMQAIERELGIIPNHQMGFRAGHSTAHQLTSLAEKLITQWNDKKTSLLISLDIEAAFDKVPHKYLLFKLQSLGYPEWVVSFLSSYFQNRQFLVKVEDGVSKLCPISAGVPQGAILSAFLYSNYTANMPVPPPPRGGDRPSICRRYGLQHLSR
jgi:hypothetical protein